MNEISPMILEDELNTKERKRIWTRKWILCRGTHGASVGLLEELETEEKTEAQRIKCVYRR